MKCPKLKKWYEAEVGQFYEEPLDCLGEECGWWHKGDERCSIDDIATNLFLISLSLAEIAKKMPKDLAPRGL